VVLTVLYRALTVLYVALTVLHVALTVLYVALTVLYVALTVLDVPERGAAPVLVDRVEHLLPEAPALCLRGRVPLRPVQLRLAHNLFGPI